MSLQIDFGIVVIILLLIGNGVTSVKRKLKEIEDKLESLCKREDLQESMRDLSGELRDLGKEINSDLKHEIEMHEMRTS